jgi:hypothetical protein
MKFTLDAAALERVFEAWNVPIPEKGLLLFALRGCKPLPPVGRGWTKSVRLETVQPDFVHMRCTIGIWDRTTGRVFAAPGSTVPHRDNIKKAATRPGKMKGRGTNQLEPGFYTDLTKGEHLQGKPQGHAALRQTGYRFYRRALALPKNGSPYSPKSPLFFGNPYDNLHCAWNIDPAKDGFRSAGCVVVAGWPHSPRLPDAVPNKGSWKIFHDLLYAAPQKKFPLLLLPGDAAAKTLGSMKGGDKHLLYGSRGEAVKALQRRLVARGLYKGRINGILGVGTYRAWNATGFSA